MQTLPAALRGESQQFERTIADAAGNTRYSLASYLRDIQGGVVEGFYVFVTDITQLKQTQIAVAEAQAYLQGVIDGASEFAIIAPIWMVGSACSTKVPNACWIMPPMNWSIKPSPIFCMCSKKLSNGRQCSARKPAGWSIAAEMAESGLKKDVAPELEVVELV